MFLKSNVPPLFHFQPRASPPPFPNFPLPRNNPSNKQAMPLPKGTTRQSTTSETVDGEGRGSGVELLSTPSTPPQPHSSSPTAAALAPYQEHVWSWPELQEKLDVTLNVENPECSPGLTTEDAQQRRALYGPNELTPPPTKPEWRRFAEKFLDPFMLLLELAAALSLALYGIKGAASESNLYVGCVLVSIILLTCFMAFYQEGQSAKLMSSFQGMLSTEAKVLRRVALGDGPVANLEATFHPAGAWATVPAKVRGGVIHPTHQAHPITHPLTHLFSTKQDVTVGDLVQLKSGERVPADVRIVVSDGLKADNSSFTGESMPVELTAQLPADDDMPALAAHNMAFSSAMLVEGEGVGVCVRVGDGTMIGSIALLASATKQEKSTLEVEVLRFVRFISVLAVVTGIVFYGIAVGRGGDPVDMFITCFVVIVIANVPEGLPATVTSCLTISARRLAARNVFVKRLDVIEALGSTTVVASDKTGTLTQNKMSVAHLWVDGHRLLTPDSVRQDGLRKWQQAPSSFFDMLYGAALCNMAKFEDGPMRDVALLLGPGDGGGSVASRRSLGSNSQYTRSRRMVMDFQGVEVRGMTTVGGGPSQPSPGTILSQDFFQQPQIGGSGSGSSRPVSEQHSQSSSSKGTVLAGTGAALGGGGGGARGRIATEEDEDEETGLDHDTYLRDMPVPRRSFSNLMPPAVTMTVGRLSLHGPGQAAAPAGSLVGTIGGSATDGFSRHHVTISDLTVGSSLFSTSGARKTSVSKTVRLPTAQVVGNPSDVALFNFVHGLTSVDQLRAERPLIYMIPFNSRTKWMLSVHAVATGPGQGHYVVYLKGAPEIVLGFCGSAWVKGARAPLSNAFKQRYEEVYKEVAGQGERVLGLALRILPLSTFPYPLTTKRVFKAREEELLNAPPAEWAFVGLTSLVDPPKPKVAEAVQKCKTAGVRVAMVTGDHPLTAEAIARQVRIIHEFATREEIAADTGVAPEAVGENEVGATVINCQKEGGLGGWVAEDWEVVLQKPELVFARASPQDKLLIVQALRRQGDVVAVTGDGVNDSPALKNADVGIAMGVGGSEVAKHAANVVLMDDDFSSIVQGIEEGRVLFDNLTKTIAYTLAHAVPELVAVVINLVLRVPLGLTSLMILSIDMLTEIAPAVSFAWEPAESNVMVRPPRERATERLVRPSLLVYAYLLAGVWEALVCLCAYGWVFAANGVSSLGALRSGDGVSPALATMGATAFYVSLIVAQAFHAFAVKTRVEPLWRHGVLSNAMMVYGVLVALGIMFFITYVPGIDTVFSTYPSLAVQYFVPGVVGGMVLVVGGELRKWGLRRVLQDGRAEDSWFYKCFAW